MSDVVRDLYGQQAHYETEPEYEHLCEVLGKAAKRIQRLRAALKRIRQTHQRLEEDANEDMLDDTILEMDEIAREALGEDECRPGGAAGDTGP
jgi:DNA primase large subunit